MPAARDAQRARHATEGTGTGGWGGAVRPPSESRRELGAVTLMHSGSPVKDVSIFLRIKVTSCCRVVRDGAEQVGGGEVEFCVAAREMTLLSWLKEKQEVGWVGATCIKVAEVLILFDARSVHHPLSCHYKVSINKVLD